jgi:NAD(P)-dependent dehydrogenase (short-subunit alcohol dehydrogenase family)
VTDKNKFGPKGWTPERLGSLTGKTYVITGANNGTGFQAARTFLGKGAKVVMLNRNVDRSTAAIEALKKEFGTGADVTFVHLDLAVLDSVRKGAAAVLESVPRIDALICNAAIAHMPTRELTADGFEAHFGVNHLGHFLLCGLLFDRIDESAGRIVMVGSKGYKFGAKRIFFEDIDFEKNYDSHKPYYQSKLAQVMFGYELQRRVQAAGKKITIQVCHPGAVRTNLLNDTASFALKTSWAVLSLFAQSAHKGSWSETLCAAEEEVESTRMYAPTRLEMVGPVGECPIDPCAVDRESAARLWTISEEKTGLSWLHV